MFDNASNQDEQTVNLQESYRLLTGSIRLSLLITTCLAVTVVIILFGQVESQSLFIWFIVICVINVIRIMVFYGFKHSPSVNSRVIQTHIRFFRFGAVMSGLVWGWAGFHFAAQVDIVYQLFISFTLGGLIAGAASSLATDKLAVIGFISATLLPNITFYFIQGGEVSMAMGFMLILFAGFMLNTARDQGRNLHENLKLRIRAKREESQLKAILNFSPVAVSITRFPSLETLFTNKRHLELFGTEANPLSEHSPTVYISKNNELERVKQKLANNQSVSNTLLKFRSQGSQKDLWCLGSFLPVNYSDAPAVLSWFFDISDRVRMEEQIRNMAYHDSLTNLPNRYLFEDRLQLALQHAQRKELLLGIVFVDLDGFKAINDTHGHDVGDELLKAVSGRLQAELRESDTLSRIGGDEFIVLLPEIKGIHDGKMVAEKLLHALTAPFDVSGHTLLISASIGIAVYPEHGTEAHTLIKHADIAMYQAKQTGKNKVNLYTSEMNVAYSSKRDIMTK